MSQYHFGATTERIQGVYWVRVLSPPAPGCSWQRDRDVAIPVSGLQTLQANETHYYERGNLLTKKHPFALTVVGMLEFEFSQDEHEPFGGSVSQGDVSREPGVVSTIDGRVAVNAGAIPTKIAAADPNRVHGISVQNVGVKTIFVSKDPGLLSNGTKASVVLSAGAVVDDGTGGVVSFDLWSGDVWAIASDQSAQSVLISGY